MRVAITGMSGSLGRHLLAQFATDGADRIVGFSRDEHKRADLQRAYAWHPGVKVYAGDIRDADRLPDIFAGCEVVIHAAARKVVSGHHDEAREMHQTNVIGTLNVLRAARVAGVSKVLFISSDKAVYPQNVYGVSKALAEHLVVSENARTHAKGLRLSVLRYGNVLGSNGSVVKAWLECLARQEQPRISDTRMTRFWLTLDSAVGYVTRAIGDMRGGEIFVPWLRAAPLTRLADAIAPGIAWLDMGIRPGGEKLHEELITSDEARRAVRRNDFIVVPPTQTADAWDAAPWMGARVEPDFTYRSDTWANQWTRDDLRAALGLKPVAVDCPSMS